MGRPAALAVSFHSSIAFRTLFSASIPFSPSDTHPGSAGTVASHPPPSCSVRGSRTMAYSDSCSFIAVLLFNYFIDQLYELPYVDRLHRSVRGYGEDSRRVLMPDLVMR